MIYLLLIGILILLVISLLISNNDLMSPSFLLCAGYLVACVSCIMNIETWGVELHFNTVVLILIGIAAFVFAQVAFLGTHRTVNTFKSIQTVSSIKVPNLWLILFCLLDVVVIVLAFLDVYRAAGGLQNTFAEMMNMYRNELNYGEEAVASTLVVQLRKFSKGSAYCFLFVAINNLTLVGFKEGFRKNFKYFIPLILYFLITLLQGGRLNFIAMALAIVFLTYYCFRKKYGWSQSKNFKFIIRLLLVFILFAICFYLLKDIVGRTSEDNFFDYVTRYFGGSIELLDQFLNSNYSFESAYRNETFPGFAATLYRLGFGDEIVHKSLEFRYSETGILLGNIYTGLRRYYADFGIIGVVIIQIIFSLIFNYLYYRSKKATKFSPFNVTIIIVYAYSIFSVVTQAMEDHFFIDLSVGYIIELLIVYITIYLILKVRV